MRQTDPVTKPNRILSPQMSRRDELLCGIGAANVATAFYVLIVYLQRESEKLFALLLLLESDFLLVGGEIK